MVQNWQASRQLLSDTSVAVQVLYDYSTARFYMWAQTDACIYLAMHIPTGETPVVSEFSLPEAAQKS